MRCACARKAVRADTGATRLWLDAYTGRPLAVRDPRNAASGDTIINWLFPLHTGEAFGSWGRAFITVFGLVPLAFAVTGVLIWWKRRSGHRRHLERERLRQAEGSAAQEAVQEAKACGKCAGFSCCGVGSLLRSDSRSDLQVVDQPGSAELGRRQHHQRLAGREFLAGRGLQVVRLRIDT
jgi:hypothetical protein